MIFIQRNDNIQYVDKFLFYVSKDTVTFYNRNRTWGPVNLKSKNLVFQSFILEITK